MNDKTENQLRFREWIIGFLVLALFTSLLLNYQAYYGYKETFNSSIITVPKMSGFFMPINDSKAYAVAVIDTSDKIGQQFASEVQAALNQVNRLKLNNYNGGIK
jgi:hypothetical protein